MLNQLFSRFQRFDRIGQQPAGIRMDFQLQPAGAERLPCQLCGKNRLFCRFGAGGVGQQRDARFQQRSQNGIAVMAQIHALKRQRHQLAAAFANGLHHQLRRGEFSGSGKQMRIKILIGNT